MVTTDRRAVLAGLALATAAPGWAAGSKTPRPLFAGTPLAANPLALRFEALDLPLPGLAVDTGSGQARLSRLTGKTRLLSLWAEWCAPCLAEARDFAALRPRYASPDLDLVALLTGSMDKLDFATARRRLDSVGATGLPLLVEPHGGRKALETLSPGANGLGDLPCTLLVDRHGRVRGRSTGMVALAAPKPTGAPGLGAPHVVTDTEKEALIRTGASAWAGPNGTALLEALKGGVLDRV